MIEIDRTVYERIDPSAYPDWNERALALPSACIFHTINWMRVVQEAYGHQPYYFGSFRIRNNTADAHKLLALLASSLSYEKCMRSVGRGRVHSSRDKPMDLFFRKPFDQSLS